MCSKYKGLLAFALVVTLIYCLIYPDLNPSMYVGIIKTESTQPQKTFYSTIIESVRTLQNRLRRAVNTTRGWKHLPPTKPIFFHETSRSGSLSPRQACAVESAARKNTKSNVYVLMLEPIRSPQPLAIEVLLTYRNTRFLTIDLVKYSKNTPLYKLVQNGRLNESHYPIYHTSDFLRFISLYKWGGIHLDLDVIVVKPLHTLARNWVAKEDNYSIGAGAISFSRDNIGRRIALTVITDLSRNFKADSWKHNGPDVLNRAFTEFCTTEDISKMSARTCHGIEVYPPHQFYPYHHTVKEKYFFPMYSTDDFFNTEEMINSDVIMHHFWNSATNMYRLSKKSLYSKLAKRYCPKVYVAYITHFEDLDRE